MSVDYETRELTSRLHSYRGLIVVRRRLQVVGEGGQAVVLCASRCFQRGDRVSTPGSIPSVYRNQSVLSWQSQYTVFVILNGIYKPVHISHV